MFTKSIVHQSIKIQEEETGRDSSSINRLLAAAAISPRYRADLLSNPQHAIQSGFGGEEFPLSESTYNTLALIKATTLPDFISQMQEKLGSYVQAII